MGPARLTKIGKYEILNVIGRGGMGVVYKAVDRAIGRLVAIKMMTGGFSDDPNLLKRFYREAQSTGTLQHPNIVTVYDLGDDAGTPYLVMEYLEGETLEGVIRSRREMLLAEKLSVIVMACDGLDYAHRRNVVHRDIKPANMILPKDGGLKIVDFGIARFGNERFTRTGQVMGSIYYMSPEQINGEESDAGTDIYSTGVVLFEFLTGELPFRGKDTASALMKILRDPVPPLSTHLRDYPAELDQIIARAMAKSRHDRYPTIEEFAFDLQRLQEDLRRELIGGYLRSAELCIEQSEWGKAKDNLRQILKLDRQNTRANELVRLVQSRIQKQQAIDQVRQFRERAEEALRLRRWEDAIACLEQALALEPNTEIARLRDSIRQRRWDLSQAMARAENAHRAGELEVAQRAIADALAVDPSDTQAKALKAIITKELADRAKRGQIEDLLGEAHREISAQKFTAALEVLKKAEAIDPAAADVQQLAAFAGTAQQQQKRKQALEKITADIEESLNRDEFGAAVSKADESLALFPNDPGLLRLRSFAEKQRDIWSRRIHIESQVAVAREMLEAGNAASATDVLKAALVRYPGDANLISLLNIVKGALSREEARSQAERRKEEEDQQVDGILARARELEANDVQKALDILEEALRQHPSNAQIDVYAAVLRERVARDRLQRDQAEAEARRREGIETEMKAARQLMDAKHPEDALELVTKALRKYPDSQDLAFYRGTIETVIAEQKKERELQLEAQKRAEIQAAVTHGHSLLKSGMADKAKGVAQEALQKLGDVPALLALLSDATVALRVEEEASKIEGAEPRGSTLPAAPPSRLVGQASPGIDLFETLPYNRIHMAPSDHTSSRSSAAPPRSTEATLGLARETQPQYAHQEVPRVGQVNKTALTMIAVVAAVLLIGAVWFLLHPGAMLVHFDVVPSGTTISVAGKECASPCDLQLKPGDYRVQATHDGYVPLNQPLEVKRGASNQISSSLERAPILPPSNPIATTPSTGPVVPPPPVSSPSRLRIHNALPGADVYLDARKLGRIDGHGNLVASVEPGNHQVRIVDGSSAPPRKEYFSAGNVTAIDGSPVVLPVQTQAQQQADLAEWERIKNSQDADQISQFLRRYPDTAFKGQALDQLENIYWTKAIASGSSAALTDYLVRYPHGPHSQAATTELAKMDWLGVANSRDETSLENYLNRHPTGPYRDQAWDRLNDIVWEKTDRRDPGALRNYLQRFSGGKYAAEANKELTELINRPQVNPQPPAVTADESQPTLFGRDQAAIMETLFSYDRSIETSDLTGMRKVWPSIPPDTIKSWVETFNLAKDIKVSVNVTSGPMIKGSVATLKASQVISFVANGSPRKMTPNITVKLRKSGQNWYIESIK